MKKTIGDLAIFGGHPAFPEMLHVGAPNLGERGKLIKRIDEALDRRWLTNQGPMVQELEERLAEFLGVPHVILVSNGTTALEIAARALDLRGEVILPSFTFVATAHAMQWLGLRPVFCDVDAHTHNLDPQCVEELITPDTSAILGVHVWGRPCAVKSLTRLADSRGLRLFFDAAHAFACSDDDQMIANFGDLEVFSFHATKFFHTFEGGAITTRDNRLAEKLRLMQNFGFSTYDTVLSLGINGKMNEISAAMGLNLLEDVDCLLAHNRLNYLHYRTRLEILPGIQMVSYDENKRHNHQYIIVEINERIAEISRDQIAQLLWAENVLARRYFYPGCHRMEPYHSLPQYRDIELPVTERLAERTLALPTGTAVSIQQVEGICQLVQFAVQHGGEIRKRLDRGE